MNLTASIEITNENDFNLLLPIAMLEVKNNNDLDKYIHLMNSDVSFETKLNTLSAKKFAKYTI